ncbi:PREDICTED: probable inactive receptor kinase At5g53320 [Nelumbo nucifera]|uniref:Uncharacterized protein n=2 Tax=Nelumbo nucifera TaxID=4432 RepID=A0A822ZG11_NELNU|nr:PREDICTED: probable inactive receptor kinase At5g53320 [Nelumbo nucifera]DAD45084.1 TPA_asm: hypothetical protein HUJ06_003314 [Nelumbo nucifera]
MLDLSGNGLKLKGTLRLQGLKLLFDRLKNLERLNSFDTSMGALKSLKSLWLSDNEMEGTFPSGELADLQNLEALDLGSNKFNGTPQIIQGCRITI